MGTPDDGVGGCSLAQAMMFVLPLIVATPGRRRTGKLLLIAQQFEFWLASRGDQAEKNTSSGDELVEIVSCRPKRPLRALASVRR